MTQYFLSAVLCVSATIAAPVSNSILPKDVDNTTPVGTNPITDSCFTTEYLGFQLADNDCSHRDLGFAGELGGKWYAVYGDTLWADRGVKDPANDTDGFHGMVRDSLAECTSNPLVVHDLNLNSIGRQNQFIPFNSTWGENNTFGFGGTSICEVDNATATGAVFYLVNANDAGLLGAGIAQVEVQNGTPTVTQRMSLNNTGYWWPADIYPHYGDIAALRDPNSEYIYAWGNPPNAITGWLDGSYVFQCRVKATDAFNLDAYEYWWGRQQGWKSEPLTSFTSETAVMWGTGQGQIVWSEFWQCYIFVHLAPGGSDVMLRTAPSPEGPWTADTKVYTATPIGGGMTYAGVAHPYLDPSGQTLVVSFTNNNNIQVIKLTFSK